MSKISLRYARALALALALGGDVEVLVATADELDLAAEVLSSAEAQNFFANPAVGVEQKETLVGKVFGGMSSPMRNLLRLVARNGKIRELGRIAASFHDVVAENAGLATAKIESAAPLAEKQIATLAAALKKMAGKKIAVETTENPALIGGIRIALGDEVIDLSLAGKLQKLRKVLV